MSLKIIASKEVWTADSWHLREMQVETPSGQVITKGMINHPGAVVLVPIRRSESGVELLMLRQYRLALAQTILELPAGTREWGEDFLACAQRELREETGYRADTFTELGQIWPAPGLSNEVLSLYLAEGLHADPLVGDVDELIEVVAMPLPELVAMAQDGRLQDAKSVVGVLRTAVYLQQ
jgi:ADP-ribose pyrophosphatase